MTYKRLAVQAVILFLASPLNLFAHQVGPHLDGLERGLEHLLRSEVLMVLAGIKPAGEYSISSVGDREKLTPVYLAAFNGVLQNPRVKLACYRGNCALELSEELWFIHPGAFIKRLQEEGIKPTLQSLGYEKPLSDRKLADAVIEDFITFVEHDFTPQSHILFGILSGLPLKDVLAFDEEQKHQKDRPDRRVAQIRSLEDRMLGDHCPVYQFTTYGEQSEIEIAQLEQLAMQAQRTRDWARAQGFSNLEIWNNWDEINRKWTCSTLLTGS